MPKTEKVAAATRIFVLSDHLMFAHGLERLLNQDINFQIIGRETNVDRAIEQVQQLQPDVVIMDSSGLMKDIPELKQILEARPAMRVVGLSLNDNILHIYQSAQKLAKNVGDLKEAICQAASRQG